MIAAEVGGLPVAVRGGVGGVLVPGHRPADYAWALRTSPTTRRSRPGWAWPPPGTGESFGWDTAAAATAIVYAAAMREATGATRARGREAA